MGDAIDRRVRLLALADKLAAELVGHAEPVAFRVAHTSDELSAILRLRYHTVTELGWASAPDLPSGVEADKFDDRAVHIGGWHTSTLVACARLVFPLVGQLLPTEEEFDTYRDLGFQVEVIGPARRHWGEIRQPIQIDVLDSVQSMLPLGP